MTSALLQAVLWVGGLCLGAILGLTVLQLAQWAAMKILALSSYALSYAVYMIRLSAHRLTLAVQGAIEALLASAWRATRSGLTYLAHPVRAWLAGRLGLVQEAWRRRASGGTRGQGQRGQERKERRAGAGGQEPPLHQPRSAYDEALELLGLQSANPLTREALKERVREIMSRIHPDKGFPNHVFAQQINAAAETIKKTKGWR